MPPADKEDEEAFRRAIFLPHGRLAAKSCLAGRPKFAETGRRAFGLPSAIPVCVTALARPAPLLDFQEPSGPPAQSAGKPRLHGDASRHPQESAFPVMLGQAVEAVEEDASSDASSQALAPGEALCEGSKATPAGRPNAVTRKAIEFKTQNKSQDATLSALPGAAPPVPAPVFHAAAVPAAHAANRPLLPAAAPFPGDESEQPLLPQADGSRGIPPETLPEVALSAVSPEGVRTAQLPVSTNALAPSTFPRDDVGAAAPGRGVPEGQASIHSGAVPPIRPDTQPAPRSGAPPAGAASIEVSQSRPGSPAASPAARDVQRDGAAGALPVRHTPALSGVPAPRFSALCVSPEERPGTLVPAASAEARQPAEPVSAGFNETASAPPLDSVPPESIAGPVEALASTPEAALASRLERVSARAGRVAQDGDRNEPARGEATQDEVTRDGPPQNGPEPPPGTQEAEDRDRQARPDPSRDAGQGATGVPRLAFAARLVPRATAPVVPTVAAIDEPAVSPAFANPVRPTQAAHAAGERPEGTSRKAADLSGREAQAAVHALQPDPGAHFAAAADPSLERNRSEPEPAPVPPVRRPLPATVVDDPAAPAPAREIKLQLAGSGQRVEVRLIERAGDVHLAVRTPDERLAAALREDLPALASRLEQSGFHTDNWHGGLAGAADRRTMDAPAAAARQDSQEPHEGRDPESNQQGQHSRQQEGRRPPPDSPHPQSKEDRKDFAWLFTSLR